MDEDNDVCPLCCEELDISDRQFFPCKCGYQVCMWCWHRIRESESGLCPACRTPYGDDPHEFSAVDMEEVVKANKEKAAAEKRERDRIRQQQAAAALSVGSAASLGYAGALGSGGVGNGMGVGGGSEGDLAYISGASAALRGLSDTPKDRNQLANMRVIRRNLVYAVGLPPTIATEETLRKADHFGQYGKIAKIVLNRNNTGNGDPRRASASAYVTFLHKEDTLTCILALDGFYVEGRNIRASFGTSKYCSAFIKNVRCNNPDCTYLHCMGEAEDTFTKQEIQAGYVTSGRDVLARQQQLAALAAGGSGRRKIGGGGPSGTGKNAANPIFPPPTYDETPKASSNLVATVPPVSASLSAPMNRAVSTGSDFSSVTSGTAAPSATTANRSKSPHNPVSSASEMLSRQQELLRTMHPQNNGSNASRSSTVTATAASVVAGVHNSGGSLTSTTSNVQPLPHTTLTSLKRATSSNVPQGAPGAKSSHLSSLARSRSGSEADVNYVQLPPNMPVPKGLTPAESAALLEQRREAMVNLSRQQREMAMKLTALRNNGNAGGHSAGNFPGAVIGTASSSPGSSVSSSSGPPIPSMKQLPLGSIPGDNGRTSLASLGGEVIGANSTSNNLREVGSIGRENSMMIPPGGRNHGFTQPLPIGSVGSGSLNLGSIGGASKSNMGNLRGDPFNGSNNSGAFPPHGISGIFGTSDHDQWRSNATESKGRDEINGLGLWNNEPGRGNPSSSAIGSGFNSSGGNLGAIGGGNITGNTGTSALASMLGIDLPTGSGSLRESTSLWDSSVAPHSSGSGFPGVIGAPTKPIGPRGSNHSLIGSSNNANISIGGYWPSNNGANNNDVALLQSLLPGVHITSGNAHQPAAPTASSGHGNVGAGWGANNFAPNHQQQKANMPIGAGPRGPMNQQQEQSNGETWGGIGLYAAAPGAPAANSFEAGRNQNQQQPNNIW